MSSPQRWGDAPVHSIAASLFARRDQVHFFGDIGYRHPPFQHCPQGDAWSKGRCSCDPSDSFGTFMCSIVKWYWYSLVWQITGRIPVYDDTNISFKGLALLLIVFLSTAYPYTYLVCTACCNIAPSLACRHKLAQSIRWLSTVLQPFPTQITYDGIPFDNADLTIISLKYGLWSTNNNRRKVVLKTW
jgi:hypothetical protein